MREYCLVFDIQEEDNVLDFSILNVGGIYHHFALEGIRQKTFFSGLLAEFGSMVSNVMFVQALSVFPILNLPYVTF